MKIKELYNKGYLALIVTAILFTSGLILQILKIINVEWYIITAPIFAWFGVAIILLMYKLILMIIINIKNK